MQWVLPKVANVSLPALESLVFPYNHRRDVQALAERQRKYVFPRRSSYGAILQSLHIATRADTFYALLILAIIINKYI